MPRQTFVYRPGLGVIEKHQAPPPSGVFHVIRDGMDALAHPCTGELMDSKSEFRKVTRAHGCIEVGNEKHDAPPRRTYDERALERDIVEAIRSPDRRQAMGESHLRRIESWLNG